MKLIDELHQFQNLNMKLVDEKDDISCPECNGDGYDLDGCMDDDNFDDCPECGGTGTTTGEDWYGPTV